MQEIRNLEACTKLESLWLGKNKITQLQGLDALTNLRILSMQTNRIVKIEGLDRLVGLQELYLSHNGIQRIEGLDQLTELKVLDLAGNQIAHVENVAPLHTRFGHGPKKQLPQIEDGPPYEVKDEEIFKKSPFYVEPIPQFAHDAFKDT